MFPELTMLNNEHAVLGIGKTLDEMTIIDATDFSRIYGGACAPMKQYRAKVTKKKGMNPSIKIDDISNVESNINSLKKGTIF